MACGSGESKHYDGDFVALQRYAWLTHGAPPDSRRDLLRRLASERQVDKRSGPRQASVPQRAL